MGAFFMAARDPAALAGPEGWLRCIRSVSSDVVNDGNA
jgi:hypothetical protein